MSLDNLLKLTSRTEVMRPGFVKYHLDGLPFDAVLHHITSPDAEGFFHDHPFSLTTHILAGSYVEERQRFWRMGSEFRLFTHATGTAHFIPAERVHRIASLLYDDCWSLILPGPWERETRFWRFDDECAWSRQWNETEWHKAA